MKVGFISLGCSKNQVDTEYMMGDLKRRGFELVTKASQADVVIVNTCGFILDAKNEAIETILEIAGLKESGSLQVLIAAGCLAQRYPEDLMQEIPELDGVIGVGDIHKLPVVLDRCLKGERVIEVPGWTPAYTEQGQRILSTPHGWAYLKISEGCSNRCTYCAIPNIRGPHRSRPLDELTREAEQLSAQGVKELIIIGQDTTAYGLDYAEKSLLGELMDKLSHTAGIEWLRLMYAHPSRINSEFTEWMTIPKVVPYLDMPAQHASDEILRRMGRRYGNKDLYSAVELLRTRVPSITLRTTLMTGFPGETERDHKENVKFLTTVEFDWAGVFSYSEEDGTKACQFGDNVPYEIKKAREDELMALQKKITESKNLKRVDNTSRVIIEQKSGRFQYTGRTAFQAPDIDGVTIVNSSEKLEVGELVDVRLESAEGYDLIAYIEAGNS
ncbi:MAG: 30S ribosomal protein S12 methylthiotransferase RimO [Candidatus Saccharibacteria bacterium]